MAKTYWVDLTHLELFTEFMKDDTVRHNITEPIKVLKLSEVKEEIETLKINNPYPEDIFIEPTQREWNQIDRILRENGFKLDKISGSVGRRLWINCFNDLEKNLGVVEDG